MRDIICFHNPKEINGFLSNWYSSRFKDEKGVEYSSMEKYMMYQKAVLFKDNAIAEKIMAIDNVAEIKAYGRMVANFNEYLWNQNKYKIVSNGVYLKFSQNEDLKKQLLAFDRNCIFAECAVHDKIWGIGLSMRSPDRFYPEKWQGENLLGKAITEVRDRLAEE
ncbi:MAG: NADAR family protein [Ruminococcus sp.]|nr:NADAR family protein [Ruminococcus sp.]